MAALQPLWQSLVRAANDAPRGVDSPLVLDWHTLGGLVLVVLVGCVANTAGVGGGAIFVPIFQALVGFPLKESTALSQALITAGSAVSLLLHIFEPHPEDATKPLIDFSLVLVLLPVLLVGVGTGVLLNVVLPAYIISILLFLLMCLLVTQSLSKGIHMWKAESKALQRQQLRKSSTRRSISRKGAPTLASSASIRRSISTRRGASVEGVGGVGGVEEERRPLLLAQGPGTPELGFDGARAHAEAEAGYQGEQGWYEQQQAMLEQGKRVEGGAFGGGGRERPHVSWQAGMAEAQGGPQLPPPLPPPPLLAQQQQQQQQQAIEVKEEEELEEEEELLPALTPSAVPLSTHLSHAGPLRHRPAIASRSLPLLGPQRQQDSWFNRRNAWMVRVLRAANEMGPEATLLFQEVRGTPSRQGSSGSSGSSAGSGGSSGSLEGLEGEGAADGGGGGRSDDGGSSGDEEQGRAGGRGGATTHGPLSRRRTRRFSGTDHEAVVARSLFEPLLSAEDNAAARMPHGHRRLPPEAWQLERGRSEEELLRVLSGEAQQLGTPGAAAPPSPSTPLTPPSTPPTPPTQPPALPTDLGPRSAAGAQLATPDMLSLRPTIPLPAAAAAAREAGSDQADQGRGEGRAEGKASEEGVREDAFQCISHPGPQDEHASAPGVGKGVDVSGRWGVNRSLSCEPGYGSSAGTNYKAAPNNTAGKGAGVGAWGGGKKGVDGGELVLDVENPAAPLLVYERYRDSGDERYASPRHGTADERRKGAAYGYEPGSPRSPRSSPDLSHGQQAYERAVGGASRRSGGVSQSGSTRRRGAADRAAARPRLRWLRRVRHHIQVGWARLPKRLIGLTLACWVVYVLLQLGRSLLGPTCSPTYWGFFAAQTVLMPAFSVVAALWMGREERRHASGPPPPPLPLVGDAARSWQEVHGDSNLSIASTALPEAGRRRSCEGGGPGGHSAGDVSTYGRRAGDSVHGRSAGDSAYGRSARDSAYGTLDPNGASQDLADRRRRLAQRRDSSVRLQRGEFAPAVREKQEQAHKQEQGLLGSTFWTYQALAIGAGIAGGLLGMGGGMIIGPVLLELGVQPQVGSATSSVMVLFSSSTALISLVALGMLNVEYAAVFAAASMFASVAGVVVIGGAIKRSGRVSLVVLSLAAVMVIGCVAVGAFGTVIVLDTIRRGDYGPSPLCT